MKTRWMSALVGIPISLALCWVGGALFSAALLLLAILALREILAAYRARGIRPNLLLAAAGLASPAWPLLAGPSAPFAVTAELYRFLLPAAAVTAILALCLEILSAAARASGEIHTARNTAYGLLCGAYVALFGGIGVVREGLAFTGAGRFPGAEAGALLLFLTLFCVWATDSFAFFTGRALGRRKLAPGISPNKTVEGALGGLAASVITGVLFGLLLLESIKAGLAVGIIAGIFGQLGDLFESALKREAGIKDFGSVMPGHGGVLDRFDSLLFVCPLVAVLSGWLLAP